LDLTFRGTQAVPQVMPCFHGFPAESICPTNLVKVKAHRGEPANEEADIQADKAVSGEDVPTEWHDRTNRAVFTWQEPRRKGGTVSYEDRKST